MKKEDPATQGAAPNAAAPIHSSDVTIATVSQEVTSVTAGMIVKIGATKVIVLSRHVRLVGAGMHWPKSWGILDDPSTKLEERTPMQTAFQKFFCKS